MEVKAQLHKMEHIMELKLEEKFWIICHLLVYPEKNGLKIFPILVENL